MEAIRLLEQVGVGETGIAIPPLIATLRDPEADVRVAACDALGLLTAHACRTGASTEAAHTATTALIGSLADPDPDVGIAAATALGGVVSATGSGSVIDIEAAFTALTEKLGVGNTEFRVAVLTALGLAARNAKVEPPAALNVDLEDESSTVRTAAVRALACFQRGLDPWIRRIFQVIEREAEPRGRTAMLDAIGKVRPPAYSATTLTPLINALGSQYDEIRLYAALLIEMLGPVAIPAVPYLIKIISHPIDLTKVGRGKVHPGAWDPATVAARMLGKIAPGTPVASEVIDALITVVRTGHPYRRVAAAHALSGFGPAAAAVIPDLIAVVRQNAATKADFADGAEAATALGKVAPGTPLADEAVTSLTEALQAKSEYTRRQAIDALLCFGSKAAVAIPRLRVLVDDPNGEVRSAAAKAIVALGANESSAWHSPFCRFPLANDPGAR